MELADGPFMPPVGPLHGWPIWKVSIVLSNFRTDPCEY